ncbi:MAG TPA: hypothetical protein VI894_01935 [Candidatus Nanoarchaeia archaeon]|nr:hypothetical protein [Candidatus Nanoarchaeia archaeon]
MDGYKGRNPVLNLRRELQLYAPKVQEGLSVGISRRVAPSDIREWTDFYQIFEKIHLSYREMGEDFSDYNHPLLITKGLLERVDELKRLSYLNSQSIPDIAERINEQRNMIKDYASENIVILAEELNVSEPELENIVENLIESSYDSGVRMGRKDKEAKFPMRRKK